MSSTFTFFADAGLTVALSPITFAQVVSGAPADRLVFFGSPASGRKLQAATAPGVDALSVSVIDADPATGLPTTAVKLASSAPGLDTAVAGDPFALGSTILSGAPNAIPVFVRVDAASATPATFTDLSLRVAGALETDQ